MEQNFFLMFLAEFLWVASFSVGHIGVTSLGIVDDMGVKKLPKVKELQAEYARLLEEKKKTYAEYRRSREEMRELLAAKANVDRLMSMEEEKQSEKEHER